MEPLTTSLADLFGANATETADHLIISKADLAAVGLDTYPDNESAIVAAIVLNAVASFQGFLVDENGDRLVDGNGDGLAYDLNLLSPELTAELIAYYPNPDQRTWDYHFSFLTDA